MKAKPLKSGAGGYVPCKPDEATHVELHMPGPFPTRILPVMISGKRAGTPNWTWNGDIELPSLMPSIRTRGESDSLCHSWVRDGTVQFLADSTHELAGQTVDLLEVE